MSTRWAFVVACDEYESRPLENCHRDADLLVETLTEWCDYDINRVTVRKLSFASPSSPDELLQSLKEFVAATDQGDTILFFFAGHGCGRRDDGWLMLPTTRTGEELESTGLSIKRVSEVLRLPGRICVRIFDACHSGVDVRDQNDSDSLARAISSSHPDGLNWVTLASCQANEFSYEIQERGQGAFTACLVDSIREVDETEQVLPGSLYESTCRKLHVVNSKHGRKQNPVINNSLSGLWGIATRAKRDLPAATEQRVEPLEMVLGKLTVERKLQQKLVKNRFEEIDRIVTIAEAMLIAGGTPLERWGVKPEAVTGKTSQIPKNMKGAVVQTIKKLNVRSQHTFQETTSNNRTSSIYSELIPGLLNPFEPSTTKYQIFDGTPNTRTVATLSWHGDEFVPSGGVLFFVVPLETKLFALVWVRVESFLDSQQGITCTLERFAEVDEDWKSLLQQPFAEAVAVCDKKIQESVAARIAYLERERERK